MTANLPWRAFFLALALSFLAPGPAFAETSPGSLPSGYVSDVGTEKSERFQEIFLFVPANFAQEKSLEQKIFNPLSKEFKSRYFETFGTLDPKSISYQRSNFPGEQRSQTTSLEAEAESDKRKNFAEYMYKRLIEHHVDNYMKSEPQMRPILEAKEKIQNVKVEVSQEVRMDINYNFAGNIADIKVTNPWCDSKLSLEMDPKTFGPSEINETKMWVGKSLTKTIYANSQTAMTDGIIYADLSKHFQSWNMGAYIGASTYFRESGTSVRENKMLVGFSKSL